MNTPTPELLITDSALHQIVLIQQHDYTVKNKHFRIKIGGKGCGGFTYDTGFTEKLNDDIIITRKVPEWQTEVVILMDRFTAFYTQSAELDYLLDVDNNEEGFIVKNHDGDRYQGKFFKNTDLVPPWEGQ